VEIPLNMFTVMFAWDDCVAGSFNGRKAWRIPNGGPTGHIRYILLCGKGHMSTWMKRDETTSEMIDD